MRNPVVIQRRSAMNKNQKYGILSQELIRRLSNISEGGEEEQREKQLVVESYTRQLKQSGYDYKETKEIIQSGYIGMARKIERRKELGIPMHREGRTTVLYRARKKILDKKMWYRKEREEGNDTEKKGGGNKVKYNRGRDRQREHRKEKEKTEIKKNQWCLYNRQRTVN